MAYFGQDTLEIFYPNENIQHVLVFIHLLVPELKYLNLTHVGDGWWLLIDNGLSLRKCVFVCSRLIEELKQQNPDFPDVSSGIYVHEVVPHSPAQK